MTKQTSLKDIAKLNLRLTTKRRSKKEIRIKEREEVTTK